MISIQQYRASIGTFHVRATRDLLITKIPFEEKIVSFHNLLVSYCYNIATSCVDDAELCSNYAKLCAQVICFLLLIGNIEANPGPKPNGEIYTYNSPL